jgi:hypothetical protein
LPLIQLAPPSPVVLYSHSPLVSSSWVSTMWFGFLGLTARPGPTLPRAGSSQLPRRQLSLVRMAPGVWAEAGLLNSRPRLLATSATAAATPVIILFLTWRAPSSIGWYLRVLELLEVPRGRSGT